MSIIGAVSGIGSIVPDRISYYLMEEYLNQDLDNDGDYDDQIAVNRTHVIFFWTNGDTDIIPLGVDLSSGPALISIDQAEIGSPAKGFLTVSGTTSRANYIDDYMTFNVEPPGEIGYFSTTYLQESQNHIEGYIQYGDVARLGMQLPRQLTDSEELILQIIPNEGMPVELNIITPEVLSASKIKLFP
jgi:archaellin